MFKSLNHKIIKIVLLHCSFLLAQWGHNHPELDWQTIKGEHFFVHFHQGTERTARISLTIADEIYPEICRIYNHEPENPVHLIIKDTDDFTNGAAYYYDNKIEIWASPLDFELRGSHSWLRNVITHEFTHIVQIQASMKFSRNIPATYFQWIGYEDEKREDVVYGYPQTFISIPFAGVTIPPWFAEGVAQFNSQRYGFDFWDSHRDMILRDRALHLELLTLPEMNTFGKGGIGNESVYNTGFAFTHFLVEQFGETVLEKISLEASKITAISFENAMERAVGLDCWRLFENWNNGISSRYFEQTADIQDNQTRGTIIENEGNSNFYPFWASDSTILYLSNKGNDYFGQNNLWEYNLKTEKSELIKSSVSGSPSVIPNTEKIVYSRKSDKNKWGSRYFDLFIFDRSDEEEKQLTKHRRARNPVVSPDGKFVAFIDIFDGTNNVNLLNLEESKPAEKRLFSKSCPIESSRKLTYFSDGSAIAKVSFSNDGNWIYFDRITEHGRDIYRVSIQGMVELVLTENYDERDPEISSDGSLIFASDKTGIFNLYRYDFETKTSKILTNVTGGAFMPAVAENGEIAYSIYDSLSYKIAILQNENPEIKEQNTNYKSPIYKLETTQKITEKPSQTNAENYTDQYTKMFILPRIAMDYGVFKPGAYFYSSEAIERYAIFGAASVNLLGDVDFFLMGEWKKFRPTLFFEFYGLTRNIEENLTYSSYPESVANLRFKLLEFDIGIRGKWLGKHDLKAQLRFNRYSTVIGDHIAKDLVKYYPISRLQYTYLIGRELEISWSRRKMKPTVDRGINPSNGWKSHLVLQLTNSGFITDFGVNSDFGTLEEKYKANRFARVEWDFDYHKTMWKMPFLAISSNTKIGALSTQNVDDFFNFFGGGMPGLKGYPYFTISGKNLLVETLTARIPIFRQKSYQFTPIVFKDLYLAGFFQFGNAWDGVMDFRQAWDEKDISPVLPYRNFKRVAGGQIRLAGYIFYAYPIAIELDAAYGLDEVSAFEKTFGREWRFYTKILFNFM